MSSTQEPICHKCNKVIIQRPIIKAMGKTWHPEHIVCKDCNEPLSALNAPFTIHDGKPVCQKCFVERYSGVCDGCKPILERTIEDLAKSCSSFFEREKQAYCKADFKQMLAARCAGCTKPVTENAIVVLNAKWHRDCFKCKKCSNPIIESTFTVEENKPLCNDCFD